MENRILLFLRRFLLDALKLGDGLTRKAGKVFAVRIIGALLQFGFFLILARYIGVDGFGMFSFGYAMLLVVSTASRWGMDQVALRKLAGYAARSEWVHYRATFIKGLVLVIGISFLISLLLLILLEPIGSRYIENLNLLPLLKLFIWSIGPFSVIQYLAESIRATGKHVYATVLQTISIPFCALLLLLINGDASSTSSAVNAFLLACFVTAVFGLVVFWIYEREKFTVIGTSQPKFSYREMFSTATPIASAALISSWLGFSETILLGVLLGSEAVAGYAAAIKMLFLFGFVVIALNNVLSPQFAVLCEEGKLDKLWSLAKKASFIAVLVSLPMFIIIVGFPEEIIAIFGSDFIFAAPALQVLALGRLFLCAAGTLGTILIMSGLGQTYHRIIALSASLNLLIAPLLILFFGVVGAAISATITIVIANIMCFRAVTRMCGVKVNKTAKRVLTETTNRWFGSFLQEFNFAIGPASTVLDVGCGSSSPIYLLDRKFDHSVGVDGFFPSLEKSVERKIHNDYVHADLLEIDQKFDDRSFDCVIAIDVIEHFEKQKGIELLRKMERIAKKRVVVMTPNGFLPQAEHSGNVYQRHLSGWQGKEMREMGYDVIGVSGWKPLRGAFALPRFRPLIFWTMLSRLSQPFVRNRSEQAFHLLCIKDVQRDKACH
ncbi:MAG: oligosaccharide flippase family protein [Mariprofundaceae bacterium]